MKGVFQGKIKSNHVIEKWIRKMFIVAFLTTLSTLGCSSLPQWAHAENPKPRLSLDTGEEEEEVERDPVSVWPEKIIIDVKVKQIMMVWFDSAEARFTKIPFSDVTALRTIPKFETKPVELQLQLKDGRNFLLVVNNTQEVSSQSQLLSAIIGKPHQQADKKQSRIYWDTVKDRANPHIVIGNLDSPLALKKLSKKTTDNEDENGSTKEQASIGEDLETIKNKGKLNRNTVDMVIKKSMNVFRSCYQRQLKKNPDLSGDIGVKFGIGEDGKVTGAKIDSSTMNNTSVEKCIVKHIYGLQFDPPAGGSTVLVYPFSFSKK